MDLGDKYDITALFVAAERQQTAMCEELIGLGADPNYGIEADIIKPRLHLVKGIVRPPHSHPTANSQPASRISEQPNGLSAWMSRPKASRRPAALSDHRPRAPAGSVSSACLLLDYSALVCLLLDRLATHLRLAAAVALARRRR